jgi:hypothetical protein
MRSLMLQSARPSPVAASRLDLLAMSLAPGTWPHYPSIFVVLVNMSIYLRGTNESVHLFAWY